MLKRWIVDMAGGLPRAFWYLWANTLISRIGSFVLILLALYLTQERGLSTTYAGFVIGLWGAGGAAGTLLGGILADRWGRKRTLLTALYGSATLMIVLGMVRGNVALAVAVALLGLLNEAHRPASTALMIDIVEEKDRIRAFSLRYWVINLGFSFAAVAAGVVASLDFRLVFVIDALTTVAGATVVAIKVREPVREPARAVPPHAAPRAGLGAVFADRVFLAYVGLNVLTALVFMQHISMLPIAMARDGLSAQTYGAVIALNGVLIVLGQLFVPRLIRGLPHTTALAIAAIVIGLGFGLTAFAHVAWFYALSVLVWTAGEMLNAPSNATTNAELSPADMRGRYQGVFSLSWSTASFLAPILGGAVMQHFGGPALWLGCFGVAAAVALLNLAAGPARMRRAAELAASGTSPHHTRGHATSSSKSPRNNVSITPHGHVTQ